LLQEARFAGRGAEAEELNYLMSDEVQNELYGIFSFAHGTTLDVERKNAADKRQERSRLVTVARASANTILRRYRAAREATGEEQRTWRAGHLQAKKRRYTNIVALAVKENPALVRRAAPSNASPSRDLQRRA
jgi:hypothetical protein